MKPIVVIEGPDDCDRKLIMPKSHREQDELLRSAISVFTLREVHRAAGRDYCLVHKDGLCDCCAVIPGLCHTSSLPAVVRPAGLHWQQLVSALQSVSLEERHRLDELIWKEAISDFDTAVRLLCAEPAGTMPDGTIRAGVIVGPPPAPGDIRSMSWERRLESLDPTTMKFLEARSKQQADDKKRKAGDRKQRNKDKKAGVILVADTNVGPADANVILKSLRSYADSASKKLERCLDEAFKQEPWASVPKARPHVEWFYKNHIEKIVREARANLKVKDDYEPETIAACDLSRQTGTPGTHRQVTSHSRQVKVRLM